MANRPIVYLATPIDRLPDHLTSDMPFTLQTHLRKQGCTVYDPKSAWASVDGQAAVQRVNQVAIDHCDGLLAWLPDEVPTVGVPMEIGYASARNKPVVVVGSAQIAKSPVLTAFEIPVYDTDAGAISRLMEWMSGTERIEVPLSEYSHYPEPSTVDIHIGTPAESPPLIFTEPDKTQPALHVTHVQYLRNVHREINRAAAKFPLSNENNIDDWLAIWLEEVVEATQAYNDWARKIKEGKGEKEIEDQQSELILELVQVGAMAARFWESLQ